RSWECESCSDIKLAAHGDGYEEIDRRRGRHDDGRAADRATGAGTEQEHRFHEGAGVRLADSHVDGWSRAEESTAARGPLSRLVQPGDRLSQHRSLAERALCAHAACQAARV